MNDHAAPTVTVSITVELSTPDLTSVPDSSRDTSPNPGVSVVSEAARERASRYADEYIDSLHLDSKNTWIGLVKAAYIHGYITREAGI